MWPLLSGDIVCYLCVNGLLISSANSRDVQKNLMDNSCASHLICSKYLLPEISCWLLTIHVMGDSHHLHFYTYVHFWQRHTAAIFTDYVQWAYKINLIIHPYHTLLIESGLCDLSCSTNCHVTYSLSSHTVVVFLFDVIDAFYRRNLISLSAIKWDSICWVVFMQGLAHMGPKSQVLLMLATPNVCV